MSRKLDLLCPAFRPRLPLDCSLLAVSRFSWALALLLVFGVPCVPCAAAFLVPLAGSHFFPAFMRLACRFFRPSCAKPWVWLSALVSLFAAMPPPRFFCCLGLRFCLPSQPSLPLRFSTILYRLFPCMRSSTLGASRVVTGPLPGRDSCAIGVLAQFFSRAGSLTWVFPFVNGAVVRLRFCLPGRHWLRCARVFSSYACDQSGQAISH